MVYLIRLKVPCITQRPISQHILFLKFDLHINVWFYVFKSVEVSEFQYNVWFLNIKNPKRIIFVKWRVTVIIIDLMVFCTGVVELSVSALTITHR